MRKKNFFFIRQNMCAKKIKPKKIPEKKEFRRKNRFEKNLKRKKNSGNKITHKTQKKI